jgi:hypothetical protein
MNLGPPAANPASARPHQDGHASGTKHGAPVRLPIEWMVDTGADIATVRNATGARFDLVATGASASPTTGGGGILVYTGLAAEFAAEDRSTGTACAMTSMRPVGVKSGNTGSEVLGMDALSSNAVEIEWSPAARLGTLWIAAAPSSRGPSRSGTSTRSELPGDDRSPTVATPRGITDHGTWVDIGGVRIEKRVWRG